MSIAASDRPLSTDRERARRRIVLLISLVYALLIVEGAIRKWGLPQYGAALFFVRDPFVLLAYALALAHGFWPRGRALLNVGLGLGAFTVLLVAVQSTSAVASDPSKQAMLAVYGWRNYFLYIPLTFVIGETFTRGDVERLLRWTLLACIPIAVLVAKQFYSPVGSPINVGIASDMAQQFRGLGLTGQRTRPMGTFTSDVGQKEFAVSCVAAIVALWGMPAGRRFLKGWLLPVATGAALTCLAFSGSRSAMLHAAIIVLAAVASAGMLRGGAASGRALLLPAVLTVAAVVLYPIVFPDGFAAFTERWESAGSLESKHFQGGIFGRALYGFVDFAKLIGDAPLTGYGLGLASNASLTLGVTIRGFTGWAETDWARHVVDLGPIVALFYIGFRCALVAWLGWLCVAATRRDGSPLALLLYAFVGLELLQAQITGHGTVNGYAWLFGGLCLALAAPRAADARERAQVPVAPAAPRFANLLR